MYRDGLKYFFRWRLVKGAGLAFLLALSLLSAPVGADDTRLAEIGLRARDGVVHVFKAEIAATPNARAKGLMFRRELAPDAGMLFDFFQPQPVTMWMKNTLIPLDMLFIMDDGRIANLAERTVPGSLTPIPADEPVRFVLELNGGTAARLGLKAGDRVVKGLPK